MKKIITALLVIAMLSTMIVTAFADVDITYTNKDSCDQSYLFFNDKENIKSSADSTVNELTEGGCFTDTDYNCILSNNSGKVDTITVATNGGLKANNGDVTTNNGTIAANNGTVSDNNGTVVVNVGTVEENDGKVEINFGEVVVDRESFIGITTSLGTVDVNYGTVTDNGYADDITIKYDAETETIILNNNETTNLGIIVDKVDCRNTNTYVAVVYEDTEVEAEWTEAQQKALETAGKLEDAKQYEGVQQAVNGTFTVYSAEKAAEMGISKEGYTLVSFEDAAGNIYKFSATVENVKNPLFLKAVYEAIRHGVAYTADDFSNATKTATLVMRRVLYTDAELAAKEMTVKVNGELVSSSDYTVSIDENGNILVTFTDAFMATLAAGEHHLQIKFANGLVYNLTIVK